MKIAFKSLMVLLGLFVLVGCNTLKSPGFPEQSYDDEKEIEELQAQFNITDLIKNYYKLDNSQRTKEKRDEIITTRLLLIDKFYNRFIKDFSFEKQGMDTFVDVAVIGIDLAVATVGGAATKAALGAASAGLTGSKLSFDKNFYFEKTVSVLITAMNAQRKFSLIQIKKGMKIELVDYSLAEALSDLDAYYFAGTFIGALESINEDAGAKSKDATEQINSLRSAYIKDVRGVQLRAFWKPDRKKINLENQGKIKAWLQENGLKDESITFFMKSKEFVEQRKKAAKDLGLLD